MILPQQDYAIRVLVHAGGVGDQGLNIGETALALASLDAGDASIGAYREFLDSIVEEIARGSHPSMDLAEQIDLLNRTLVHEYGFCGDSDTYNDLANANLMRVIDRRRGLPVALGILYLHVGRSLGWQMAGLSFPGHFLLRIEKDGQRAILDPFDGGAVRNTAELRQLLKSVQGPEAELLPEHYEPVSDRSVLLRLQNNIKLRRLQRGSLEDAVQTLQTMVLFAPLEAMLWRELGLFQARLGRLQHAIVSLETFMSLGVPESLRHQTAILLQKLRSNLQ
jgi:regulator of sirC expression with transglutaminase-like and TPR domain